MTRYTKIIFFYFILKLLILVAIIFALDFFIGNILGYLYFNQGSGELYRTTYSIEKTTADILVFGSSRAKHHYHSDVFRNHSNLSFYNTGRAGNFIFYYYAILKGVTKRYTPKIIILDLVRGEFSKNQNSYDRISSLLPYYRKHSEIRPIIELKGPYEKFKLLSYIYPYNSSVLKIIVGNLEFNKKRSEDVNGYVAFKQTWEGYAALTKPVNDFIQAQDSVIYNIDSTKVKIYESFIHECISSKIKLYIVCSPYFNKSSHKDYSLILSEKIARRNNVMFFDYSEDPVFVNNPELFGDEDHLNDSGAKIFSDMLIHKICEADSTFINHSKLFVVE